MWLADVTVDGSILGEVQASACSRNLAWQRLFLLPVPPLPSWLVLSKEPKSQAHTDSLFLTSLSAPE